MQPIDPAEFVQNFDLADKSSVNKAVAAAAPDFVIHLAAISFVAHENPLDFYSINTVGTANLLEALGALTNTPRKIVVASSANIYGNSASGIISEGSALEPVNHYSCSKLAMEKLTAQWFGRLPIIITRPFNYTGVGQSKRFLVPKIVDHFRHRAEIIELGNVDVVRDFSDVRTVASNYVSLLLCDSSSEIVNVCSGRGRSLRSIIATSSALTGHSIAIRTNPAFVRADEVHTLIGSDRHLSELIDRTEAIDFERTISWMLEGAA